VTSEVGLAVFVLVLPATAANAMVCGVMTPDRPRSPFTPSRRALLGLGGAAAMGLVRPGAALAAASPAGGPTAAGCPTGRDPEPAGVAAVEARAARAAPRPDAAAAPPLDLGRRLLGQCHYSSRPQWGADESLRFRADGTEIWPPTYWPVQTFTVHHTADGSTDPVAAARLRSIYRNDAVGKGYGDLGYQFVIDPAGVVYEGRWSGDDGLPGFDASGRMVNGAHVAGYNAGNVGIALLGDFTAELPAVPAYRSLVRLLAVLTRWQDVDPLEQVAYVNPISGATATVPAIAGHRDWAPTLCPGDTFAPTLGALRADVARLSGRS
jgi:N-acetylmuramoyl-L-alanine amidase